MIRFLHKYVSSVLSQPKYTASAFICHLFPFQFISFSILVLLFGICLDGCSSTQDTQTSVKENTAMEETTKQEHSTRATAAKGETSRDNTPSVLVPTTAGKKILSDKDQTVTLDISNKKEGYLMAAYHGDAQCINIQITGPDLVTYMYYIYDKDKYAAFPFSAGDGYYTIAVYENVEGDVYSSLYSKDIEVTLTDLFLPFLYSNQFIFFDSDTKAIEKGAELAQNAGSDLDVVTNIYNYVVENISYDYDKAKNVTSPYYPDVDETMETGKGICFDYSALMCTMLRTQQIPTKLNIGYADGIYHAWISTYIDSIGWVDNIIQFDGTDWTMMDPTFASTDGKGYEINTDDYILMFQR